MRHWEHAPMPRIAPRVGATRQPCRLRLTDGTHTARHRLAPHPRHTRERPRQPTRTRCTVPRSHCHARALRASVARRHRASCTGSIERSKPVVLRVCSLRHERAVVSWAVGGACRRERWRGPPWHDARGRAVVHVDSRATRAHRGVTLVHLDMTYDSAGSCAASRRDTTAMAPTY